MLSGIHTTGLESLSLPPDDDSAKSAMWGLEDELSKKLKQKKPNDVQINVMAAASD